MAFVMDKTSYPTWVEYRPSEDEIRRMIDDDDDD
jgi:hypothetical protein